MQFSPKQNSPAEQAVNGNAPLSDLSLPDYLSFYFSLPVKAAISCFLHLLTRNHRNRTLRNRTGVAAVAFHLLVELILRSL